MVLLILGSAHLPNRAVASKGRPKTFIVSRVPKKGMAPYTARKAGGAQLTPGDSVLSTKSRVFRFGSPISREYTLAFVRHGGICFDAAMTSCTAVRTKGCSESRTGLGKSDFELRQSLLQEMGEEGDRILTKSDDGLGWM